MGQICITGSKGFVGRHLCNYLKQKGVKFVEYDLVDGFDIRNKYQFDKFFEEHNFDSVIHLAALAGVRCGESYEEEYISTNIMGTRNIVKMCEKYKIKHLISYSSSSVYGEGNPPIKEGDSKNPISIYGITKLAAECIVNSSAIKQTTILIPFTIYGGDSKSGRKDAVIHKWIEQIKNGEPISKFGDGTSERGYVYIGDIVDITYRILKDWAGGWKHETFNIGGSEVITLNEMIDVFKANVKGLKIAEFPLPKVDIYKNCADTSKVSKLLNWHPEPKFEDNLKRIIKKEL